MDVFYNDLISIVVPVYNVKNYLEECVYSLIGQSYRNIEIILVDDGSTDGSSAICDRFEQEDPRITVIRKSNGGLSEARNVAIKIAKGDYIGFIDSDDWADKDMFYLLLEACKRNSADISVCGLERVYRDRSEIFCPSEETVLLREDGISELFQGRMFGDQVCTKLYRTYLFSGIEYPVGRQFEDVFTTYKLFFRANRIAIVNKALYFYRQRKSSITGAGYNLKKLDIIYALQSVKNNPLVRDHTEWLDLLSIRENDAICWTLIDMFMADRKKNSLIDQEKELFCKIRDRRKQIIKTSVYRSCKMTAVLSFSGFTITRGILSSGFFSGLIEKKHQYYS